jgi:TRAP-type C4-dicarboxylate transport system substrate-binding protein
MLQRRALLAALAPTPLLPVRAAAPWRLATGYRADSFHGQNLAQFARELAAAGGSAIELHANNTLAQLADIPKAVRGGQAEAGEAIMTGLAAEWPLAGADSLPFMVRSYADARRLWLHQRPLIEAAFAGAGLHVLMAVPWAASERVADEAVLMLRQRGMKVERPSAALLADIKRLGERFSIEWVREVGAPANQLLIPYYSRQ